MGNFNPLIFMASINVILQNGLVKKIQNFFEAMDMHMGVKLSFENKKKSNLAQHDNLSQEMWSV